MPTLRGLTFPVAVLGAVAAGAAGCVIESPPPESATLRVATGGETLVVTSWRFNSIFRCSAGSCLLSDEVAFLESDTILVSGSHERTVVLPDPARFFVRATSLSDGNDGGWRSSSVAGASTS